LKRKEIYWFVGTIVLVLILILAIFGLDGFKTDTTLVINIYDTYFVISNLHFITLIFVFSFFTIYLLRTIRRNFMNVVANLMLIIITILFVLVLGKTIETLDFFSEPLNKGALPLHKNPVGTVMRRLSTSTFAFQIGLLILLAYCGFKTGQNYNAAK